MKRKNWKINDSEVIQAQKKVKTFTKRSENSSDRPDDSKCMNKVEGATYQQVNSSLPVDNFDGLFENEFIDFVNFFEAKDLGKVDSSSTLDYSDPPRVADVTNRIRSCVENDSNNSFNFPTVNNTECNPNVCQKETSNEIVSYREEVVGASNSEPCENNNESVEFDLELDLVWLDGILKSNNFDNGVTRFDESEPQMIVETVECYGKSVDLDKPAQNISIESVSRELYDEYDYLSENGSIDEISEVESDFLNKTYDILEVENVGSSLDQPPADDGLNENLIDNEKSTLDGVVHFLENRSDDNVGSNVTYVLKPKSDGSVEVEMVSSGTEMIYQGNLHNGSEAESEAEFEDESEAESNCSYMSEPDCCMEIVPLGSNNYRDNKGYLYTKNNLRKSNLYLCCKNSKKHGCKARVTVREYDYGKPIMTIKHNHPHDNAILDKSIFDKKLEQNIDKNPFDTPRQLYLKTKTDLLNIINTENIPPLKKKEGFIYRRQRKYIPLLPSTIEEFETFISDTKYRDYFSKDHRNLPYYRGVWTSGKGERNLVFISETILKLVNTMNGVAFFIDGTYKALPHHIQFRQLYVINIIFDDQCYPLAYIFMEKKTFTSYDTIFANLKWLMPAVEVTKVMSDYEAATRKALKKHYPNARVSGCFFHYVQAIVKSTKKFGLKRDDRFKDAIQKLCVLALLPNDFVLKGFQSIDDSIKFKSKRWNSFKSYWMKQWLPANISVYGLVHRSNNFSESNNKSLNLLLKGRHPNIWRLIMNLKLLEMDKSDLIIRAKNGEMISTKRNRGMVRLNDKIKEATESFNKDQNVEKFLERVTLTDKCEMISPKRNRDMIRLNDKIKEATELFDKDQDVEKFLRRITFEENLALFVKDQINIMDDDGADDDNEGDEEVLPNHYNIESDFRKNHPREAAMRKL